jgi:hypothetical protein
MKRLIVIIGMLVAVASAHAQLMMSTDDLDALEEQIRDDPDRVFFVRLINGDVLTGPLLAVERSDDGVALRIGATIGRAKVYLREIAFLRAIDDAYRHRHRGYILPTAQPIGDDHFLGVWELAFLYAGGGIGPISITGGRTLVPGIPMSDQFSVVNVKVTVHEADNGLVEGGKQYYAVGVNGAWLNDKNFMGHVYGSATFTGRRTQVTTTMFAKVSGEDLATINVGTLVNPFVLPYANGAIGIGLSLDTRMPSFNDLHVIAELANADITRPANTILYLGLRTASSSIAMDFGIALAPGPLAIPAVAFAWTPF